MRCFSLLLVCAVASYKLPVPDGVTSRRAAVSSGVAAALFTSLPAFAAPLLPCPAGSKNCFSSSSTDATKVGTWTWPTSSSRDSALVDISSVIDAYPQAGQSGVDLGGWSFAIDELKTTGFARIEFKSGLGNFAKFFNGNSPFIDDLEFNVEPAGVCVRSSSRVGDSDFGVNAKRLNWIADKLRAKGWTAADVKPA